MNIPSTFPSTHPLLVSSALEGVGNLLRLRRPSSMQKTGKSLVHCPLLVLNKKSRDISAAFLHPKSSSNIVSPQPWCAGWVGRKSCHMRPPQVILQMECTGKNTNPHHWAPALDSYPPRPFPCRWYLGPPSGWPTLQSGFGEDGRDIVQSLQFTFSLRTVH